MPKFNVISKSAVKRRAFWIDEIVKISGRFGDDASRVVEELTTEIRHDGVAALVDHLRLCGAIPEHYGHDSSEEKLYSKYTDGLLAASFQFIGLNSNVVAERADSADVEAVGAGYSMVGDAKVFRLSRTAKNQKDFRSNARVEARKTPCDGRMSHIPASIKNKPDLPASNSEAGLHLLILTYGGTCPVLP